MEQFEVRGWVAIYGRYESAGLYQSIDDAINAGIEKFKINGAHFYVFHNDKKVAHVCYRWGTRHGYRCEWIPTVTRF